MKIGRETEVEMVMGLMLMYRHKQPKCLPNDFNEFSPSGFRLNATLSHSTPKPIEHSNCLSFVSLPSTSSAMQFTYILLSRMRKSRAREREKKRKIYNKSLCCFVCRFIQTGECIDILYQAMRKFILVNSQWEWKRPKVEVWNRRWVGESSGTREREESNFEEIHRTPPNYCINTLNRRAYIPYVARNFQTKDFDISPSLCHSMARFRHQLSHPPSYSPPSFLFATLTEIYCTHVHISPKRCFR